jgi:hypothetical protein
MMSLLAPEPSRAGAERLASAEAPGALLYLDPSGWRQADRAQKTALAADFMRIYCGNPAMPPQDLVACLDQVSDSGSLFAHALSCVATGNRGPRQ